jgi:phosphate uptake regulator
MERRKVSTLGKYSLVVTLPKNWTEMNNIESGDEVSLKIQDDGSLAIHPSFNFDGRPNEITLHVKSLEDVKMIKRKIIACYLNGFDKIVIKSEKNFTRDQQDGIREIVKSLYMRIYESSANSAILQAFMDESLASVVSGIQRMHIITSSMAKDLISALKEWDLELAKSFISLEEDVDQFRFFLTRLLRTASHNPSLASKLQISLIDCFDYHLLINRIEYIADHITTIALSFIELHKYRAQVYKPGMDVIINALSKSFEYYDKAVDGFFEGSIEDTGKIIDYASQSKLIDEGLKDLPYLNDAESRIVILCHLIMDEIGYIRNITADIAEITIDRHYNPP